MGSDDLFHKRKARSAQDLKRREAQRESYERTLIVCEGEKTEPLYFGEWRSELRINHANLEILGNCDPDPVSVVQHGIAEAQRDGEFDRVFCVFDRDEHANFDEALQLIDAQDGDVFKAVRSIPCFEYWLLLHFEYSAQPMTAAQTLAALQGYLPDYQKSATDVLAAVAPGLDDALGRAGAIRKDGQQGAFINPYTIVDVLIRYLRGLKA